MTASLYPAPSLTDDDSVEVSSFRLQLIACELARTITADNAFEKIDELDRLVNDLLESYAGLRVATRNHSYRPRSPLN